ncbi:FMR1 neighbor protein isoform X2 [Dipodomys merriami]|uniref:FMR1 neighbor protein isoform X2 n=1 Tax=Dipodomys merriami TaxID=94247 RepID=UPI003855CB32
MPTGSRSPRGRPSFRGRVVRSARLRLLSVDNGENPAIGPYRRRFPINPHYAAYMAALPQPGRLANAGGFWWEIRQTLATMWSFKLFGLLMLFMWTIVIFSYILHVGSETSKKYTTVNGEDADVRSLEKNSFKELVDDFFFPTTCMIKENQELEACSKKGDLKEPQCLKHKCCYSPLKTDFKCFIPTRDKSKQMVRIFGICMISVIFLGCLPMYCCSICRRSPVF